MDDEEGKAGLTDHDADLLGSMMVFCRGVDDDISENECYCTSGAFLFCKL